VGIVTVDAIVLQVFRYSDTSKILRLLTRGEGLRSAMARGALRPKSRFGGVLEPFAQGSATLFLRDTRELQSLQAFELSRSRQGLGRHLMRFGAASLLAEILLRTESEHAGPEVFDRLSAALSRLDEVPDAELAATALAEAWGLVALLGFAPELGQCVACGRRLAADEPAGFDLPAGGVRCSACAGDVALRRLPPGARAALQGLLAGRRAPIERTTAHWHLLERFLFHHLGEGAVLRSMEFIAAALDES
jgi:DNA repair protein RecO (recombination protein O)